MRRPDRPTRALGAVSLALALALVLGLGCVSSGKHAEVAAERDRLASESAALERRVEILEVSYTSVDAERVRLSEALEDMGEERVVLRGDVESLRKAEAQLSASLEARQRELEATATEVVRLQGTYESLVADLEEEVSSGRIEIQQLRDGLRMNVSDEILFASGSARLNGQGQEILRKVAGRLAGLPHRIEVQGHTDNLRIAIGSRLERRYHTNWELAGARAASVVRLFEEAGIPGARLSAVSYAEFQPIVPNDSAEDRKRNRRIEIRLLPEASATSQTQVDGADDT